MIDIAYGRVSTDEQNSDGKTSLPDQIEKCTKYLENLGFTDIKSFSEDYSGYELDRPELDKIKALIKAGKVRSICFTRVDRLTRKVGHLDELRDRFLIPSGIKVFSTDDLGAWNWEPAHVLMQNTMAAFGQMCGATLKSVMQQGKRSKVRNGNTLAMAHAPFGYTEVKTKSEAHFEIDEFEAEIVRNIYRWYVIDKWSLRQIAKELNDTNTPTYTTLRDNHFNKLRPDKKAVWYGSSLRKLMTNTVYIGEWRYKDMVVKVPAIVSVDIFNQAQKLLVQNKNTAGRPTKYEILLSRRMVCQCGLKVNHTAYNNGKNLYYVCDGSKPNRDVYNGCDVPLLDAPKLDNAAWDYLSDLILDTEKLEQEAIDYFERREAVWQPMKERLDYLESSKCAELEKSNRLTDLYLSGNQDKTYINEVLAPKQKLLTDKINELNTEIDELKSKLQSAVDMWHDGNMESWLAEQRQAAIEFEARIKNGMSFAEKKEWIEKYDLRGEIVLITDAEIPAQLLRFIPSLEIENPNGYYIKLTARFGSTAMVKLCNSSKRAHHL